MAAARLARLPATLLHDVAIELGGAVGVRRHGAVQVHRERHVTLACQALGRRADVVVESPPFVHHHQRRRVLLRVLRPRAESLHRLSIEHHVRHRVRHDVDARRPRSTARYRDVVLVQRVHAVGIVGRCHLLCGREVASPRRTASRPGQRKGQAHTGSGARCRTPSSEQAHSGRPNAITMSPCLNPKRALPPTATATNCFPSMA